MNEEFMNDYINFINYYYTIIFIQKFLDWY